MSKQLCQPGTLVGNRPTDHSTRSVTIGGAYSGEAKFCFCPRLQGVSLCPPESSMQTTSRSLRPFLPGSIGDRPTDGPTDDAIRSIAIGGAHSGEAKFCYCLWLQQIFIGAVDSTDWINFSNQQLYSAAGLDGLQCMWRHTTI